MLPKMLLLKDVIIGNGGKTCYKTQRTTTTTTKQHKCYGLKKGTFLMINFTEGKTKTGSRLLIAARKRTKKETK